LIVRAEALFAVPFVRDAFLYRGADGQTVELHRVAPVYGGGSIAVGLQFE
jgi:hypothetical protein